MSVVFMITKYKLVVVRCFLFKIWPMLQHLVVEAIVFLLKLCVTRTFIKYLISNDRQKNILLLLKRNLDFTLKVTSQVIKKKYKPSQNIFNFYFEKKEVKEIMTCKTFNILTTVVFKSLSLLVNWPPTMQGKGAWNE